MRKAMVKIESLGETNMTNEKPRSELELEFEELMQWLEERAAAKAGQLLPRGHAQETRPAEEAE